LQTPLRAKESNLLGEIPISSREKDTANNLRHRQVRDLRIWGYIDDFINFLFGIA